MSSIGNAYPSPPIGSARALFAQMQAEERAEREAALAAQQAADIERGRERRERLAEAQVEHSALIDEYEALRAQLDAWLVRFLAVDERITSFGQQSLITADVIALNVPSLAAPDQWRQRSFSTTEAKLHQRASERRKRVA